jgi:hypothetical protein
MSQPDDEILSLNPRLKVPCSFEIPQDVADSLQRIADGRDLSVEALVKLYIGQGLRQDLAKQFSDRVLDLTASVLARHVDSEEVAAILREIRDKAAAA